jgi:stage II sporulation protein D
LSTEAVDLTKGEVVVYKGDLIEALYTSTCGGRTENVEDVFMGPALPYLRSTECTYESQKEWNFQTSQKVLPNYSNSRNISYEIAALTGLGVLSENKDPAYYKQPSSFSETRQRIQKAAEAMGLKQAPEFPDKEALTYRNFTETVISVFDWNKRVENLLLDSEKTFLTKEMSEWNGKTRSYAAYFIQSGVFSSLEEIQDPEKEMTRGEVAYCLWKILLAQGVPYQQGQFVASDNNEMVFEVDHGDHEQSRYSMAEDAYFIKNYEGTRTFVSHLRLVGGEKVKFIKNGNQIVFLEVMYPHQTNVLDRKSTHHRWRVRKSIEEISRRVNRFYPVGDVQDLVPIARGDSNRIAKIKVKGTEGEADVSGLRIRRVLGLRETYFVIDREYDENGNIRHFTFNGKGWGHGVGLCQVGAFGMARAGADYKEILKKYYQGVHLKNLY